MKKSVKYIIPFILFCSLLPVFLAANDGGAIQAGLVAEFFAKELNVTLNQIDVEIIHKSSIDHSLLKNGHLEIQMGRGKLNLGHQTLWIIDKENGVINKRFPITVNVYATLMVPTASSKISRQGTISDDLLVMVPKRLGREFKGVILDPTLIYDKMTTQIIKQGSPIKQSMIRTRPDVLLGDKLEIIVLDQGLSLALPGIAKEDACIGEIVRVQCPTTRKELRGILDNSNQVIVNRR